MMRSDIRILVLQRGWVYVGRYQCDDRTVRLTDARCIRFWGTTGGLAELATSGPTEKTKLESPVTVEAPLTSVINTIQCNASAWGSAL